MPIPRKNIKTALIRSLLFLMIFAIGISILVIPYMTLIDKKLPLPAGRLMQDIISLIPVLFASWMMTKYIDKLPFGEVGLKNKRIVNDSLIGTGLAMFWIVVSFGGQYLFGTIAKNEASPVSTTNFCVYALALLINAATQELLCRGYLFQTIQNYIGVRSALVLTSLLFLGMHAGALQAGVVPSLNVFGAGVIFAIARYKTGNLWMPVAIHFIWNFIYSSVLLVPTPGYGGMRLFQLKGNTILAGGTNGIEATIITTVSIIIIIITEVFVIKKRKAPMASSSFYIA